MPPPSCFSRKVVIAVTSFAFLLGGPAAAEEEADEDELVALAALAGRRLGSQSGGTHCSAKTNKSSPNILYWTSMRLMFERPPTDPHCVCIAVGEQKMQ